MKENIKSADENDYVNELISMYFFKENKLFSLSLIFHNFISSFIMSQARKQKQAM